MVLAARIKALTVRVQGERVLLLHDGRLVADLPWKAAQALAKALAFQANRAEEWAKAERVALDQAILMRTGAPFGLTDDWAILGEARKLAAWDSRLRRYIPSIRSREAFGRPAVIVEEAKDVRKEED